MKNIVYCGIALASLSLFSCSTKSSNTEQNVGYSTDINLLSKELSLNIKPLSVKWVKNALGDQNTRAIGPTDYHIIAIVEYDSVDFAKTISGFDTTKTLNHQIFLDSSFTKEWFDASIKKSFVIENEYLKIDPHACSAKPFFKYPFVNGYCFYTNDNRIFISLYAT